MLDFPIEVLETNSENSQVKCSAENFEAQDFLKKGFKHQCFCDDLDYVQIEYVNATSEFYESEENIVTQENVIS
jgi:hypothetical protein